MYCTKCGNPVYPDDQFCPVCGNMIGQPHNQYTKTYYTRMPRTKTNVLALTGFITACASLLINLWGLVGIAALVLSIIGFYQIGETNEKGKGFAVAGIIIGGFSILYGLAAIFFIDTVLSLLFI